MAHMVETMAYAGEVPWHGLGTKVTNDLSVDEMLKQSGLDWKVRAIPMFAVLDGKTIPSSHKMLVRESDGHQLTVITDKWNPVQNSEAFEFFREFIDAGDMEMHTAGSLRDGQWVWVLAKVKESFTLFEGKDQVDSYLLFSNPHIYGRGVEVRFTPTRVVCNNTLNLSLGQASVNKVSLNHRSVFDPEMVKEALGIAHEKLVQYKEMGEFLGSKRYSNDSVVTFMKDVFPGYGKTNKDTKISGVKEASLLSDDQIKALGLSRNAQGALEILETQPGATFAPGSWWNAFNAVTYMTDHVMGKTQESRLTSAWYGLNKSTKIKALEKAVEYAEAA